MSVFFFSSRRRHTRCSRDWSSDVCSSDLFTVDGVVPDVIINPHAIPSRMTIGQFVETLGGKVASQVGELMDGTSFENIGPHAISEILGKLGFQKSGRETLYNGITGERLAADLFIGVV